MSVRITSAIIAAIAAGPLVAQGGATTPQSFQYELIGGWSSSETDASPDLEINRYIVAGIFHLKPVTVGDHPWNEAPFLEHSSAVNVGVDYTDFEVGAFSADGPRFSAGYTFADKETPIAASVNLSLGTLDGDAGVDIDFTDINGAVGYWLRPNALVGFEIGMEEIDAGPLLEIEQMRYGFFGKLVHDLGERRAINVEAHLGMTSVDDSASDEDNFEVGVAGDFYFTPQYSVGALLDFSFGDAASEEGTTVGIRGSAWFCPQGAVNLEWTTFMADDNNGADEDTLSLFFNLRF
ncbi:MAG TPA: hypothetical protein VF384_06040 [Planctomycetota bacterium]